MATLSRRERRLLHEIERGLLEDDPRLAGLLSGRGAAPARQSVRGLVSVWLALALLLVFGGLILHEMAMVLGGMTVLAVLPLAAALVILVNRAGR